MFSKIIFGAILGSLAFVATESIVHAGTPKAKPQIKRSKFNPKKDMARGQTAPELGFAMDILDMKDWKSLRDHTERTPFTSLASENEPAPQKKNDGS
jgi:hypothetical protein